jgi:hypothetical protein
MFSLSGGLEIRPDLVTQYGCNLHNRSSGGALSSRDTVMGGSVYCFRLQLVMIIKRH